MGRMLDASSVIVGIAAVAGCFAPTTVYGGSGWYAAPTVVHATVQEPGLIAVSESAPPPMDPLGEWMWTDAGWRWVSSAMVAEPSVPFRAVHSTVKQYVAPSTMMDAEPTMLTTDAWSAPAPMVGESVQSDDEVIEHDAVRVTVVPLHAHRADP